MSSTTSTYELAALREQVVPRPLPRQKDERTGGFWVERDGVMFLIVDRTPRVQMPREDFDELRLRRSR